ncbi:MAG: prepilin-type N-terminal cleavage/methylation domain-containing protein [bacterium]|nr:MAG: prepilin-type N-terminal cleavage/methylation domain-containing protein [bacterium]
MIKKNIGNSGYTLIELLVGISIIGIVFSIGLAGYREFSRRQELVGVIKRIVADLRLSQQLAIGGQKPEGEVCNVLDGYSFSRISQTEYNLIANCSNANHIIKVVELPSNVSLTQGSVMFKALGQGTNLEENLTFTVTNVVSSSTGTVTIGVGGNVE